MPEEERTVDDGPSPDDASHWHPVYGDRLQQLVFIGQNLEAESLRHRLDACLLAPELEALGLEEWASLPNPFREP